jgi:hypothetical protein
LFFDYFIERSKGNDSTNRLETCSENANHGRLLIPDESTLSRLVAARLGLPISQQLLDRQFKPSIIKRCWEDQLRLKCKFRRFYLFEGIEMKTHFEFDFRRRFCE